MMHIPIVIGYVGSMAPNVQAVYSMTGKQMSKVKSYMQERGMTQINELLAHKVTTITKVELWYLMELPPKIPIVPLHTYERRSKGKKALTLR